MAPNYQATVASWHYIDCTTGSVVAYTTGVTAVNGAYTGAVYSPTQNRIYLMPTGQSNQTSWHYIDCNTGSVVAYTAGVTAVSAAYYGGAYSPTQNRIYLAPQNIANQATWHCISSIGDRSGICPYQFGSTILSSTL